MFWPNNLRTLSFFQSMTFKMNGENTRLEVLDDEDSEDDEHE